MCGAYLWRLAVFGSCTSDFPEAVPPLAALMVLLAPGFPRGMVARRSVLRGASAALGVATGPQWRGQRLMVWTTAAAAVRSGYTA